MWVLLEVVEHLNAAALEARYVQCGPGRRAYDPRMLLALLIYAYSAGVRSSRQIERSCRTDVAMRVICGLHVPDHTVIARFRQQHQDAVRDLFTQVLVICAKAGLGRLGVIAVDGTKIAANASKKASCRRQWLQQQVEEILTRAAAEDAAEDTALGVGEHGAETPRQLRGRRDRQERIKRALAEVIAEEAERGLDAESAAAKERAFVEATRAGRNDVGSRPIGADPVAIAEARLQAAQDRLAQEIAAKRERIAVVREQMRRFEAGQGPRPHLGPFSFDENRGQQVARAKRWVARAERELATVRTRKTAPEAEGTHSDLSPVPGGGRHGPRGITVKSERPVARRNVTDPDSRLMHDSHGGTVQGYNAQLAVADDGLILATRLVQDVNDRRQLRPMSQAALHAALLLHQARCLRQCPTVGGCCITISAAHTADGDPHGCTDTDCPCRTDWMGPLLFDAGYWSHANLTAPGPDRLIAPGKTADLPAIGQRQPPHSANAAPAALMIERLATEEGAALYKRRGATIEPVNGHLKDRTGLRRFARRGLTACQAELTFAAMVLNLGKFCRLAAIQRTAALAK
ncbi:transposase [Nonomuraea sp. NPDC049758]|uniref:transposase n=1 Tax=Nonomuraea sp. NPDC049758 TaxID=3154360 RepID=UPI0034452702